MNLNTSPTEKESGRWVISKFGPPEVLKWETADFEAELDESSVLVRIIAAGISGTENLQRAGGYPDPHCRQPGFTPGYEFVGEVVKLGADAKTDLKPGTRVASMCVYGGHATHTVISPEKLIPIGEDDDPVKIAALPLNYMTAWGMLKRTGVDLKPGSSILIGSAAGGVGTAMAQIVKSYDMGLQMIGTCSPWKFEYLRSLGVTPVDRTAPDIGRQVKALTTDGEGVDVAFDSVGSKQSLQQSHLATKPDTGEVIVIGFMADIAADGSGMATPDFDLDAVMAERAVPRMKFWGVEGTYYTDSRDLFIQDFHGLVGKVREGRLDPIILKLYRLRDAVEVNKKLVSGAGIQGKMIFVVDDELAKKCGL